MIRTTAVLLALCAPATAEPLALLAPPAGDDARQAVALGPHGELYAPDGKGAWIRTQRITTVDTLTVAGRAGQDVVAAGDGVVYKLAGSGWSAFRLHQKDKAVMAGGQRAVAAVKRQLYALRLAARGEPEKLALAPSPVLALGAGKTIVIATERGLFRVEGTTLQPITGAPRQVLALVDDRWAIVAAGAYDLAAKRTIAWPAGAKIAVAAAGPDDSLLAVASVRGGALELFTVRKGAVARQPIDAAGTAVGIAADRAGRIVIALTDGRIIVHDRGTWRATQVSSQLPADRPGAGPAASR